MRSVLIGAVRSTEVALAALYETGHPPEAVFTVSPDISHRNMTYVNLAGACDELTIPCHVFTRVGSDETVERLRELSPEFIFVIGLSQIVQNSILELPKYGCIGYHPAALPKNRGRAVIPWAILQGLQETASTLFWLDAGLDSGPIIMSERVAIAEDETAGSLIEKHMQSLDWMMQSLPGMHESGSLPARPQDEVEATWCARRGPGDGIIDWRAPAREVWTLVRAVGSPYHGAFASFGKYLVTVWKAELWESGRQVYWGIPGQIQAVIDGNPLVQCGDGNQVLLTRFTLTDREGREVPVPPLRVHERFGSQVECWIHQET